MKKKIASLFLAIAVFASLCVSAMALDPVTIAPSGVQRFTDVPTTHWAFAYVDKVASIGLFNGLTPTTFGPSDNMSRGQFVMVLARMEGQGSLESVPTDSGFSDVPRDHRFAGVINWAKDKGIVGGYTDGTFKPGQPISRAQFAAMIHRYIDYKQYDQKNADGTYKTALNGVQLKIKELSVVPAQFPDYNLVSDVFKADVDYARLRGMVQGFSDGTLRPNIAINRGQIAAILARFIDLLVDSGYSPFLDGTDQRNSIYATTPRSGGGGGSTSTPATFTVNLTVTDDDAMNDGAAYGGTVKAGNATYTQDGVTVGTTTTRAAGNGVQLGKYRAGAAVTFTVEPNTTSTNAFGIVGGKPSVQTSDGLDLDPQPTKNANEYTFNVPSDWTKADTKKTVEIVVGFSNASIRASLNGNSMAAIYDASGNLLTGAPTNNTTYTVRINALKESGETAPGVYDNGGSLKSFRVLVDGKENNSYLTAETQSLGLYNNTYNDGIYQFVWHTGEVVDFAVVNTTYKYDLTVKVNLSDTEIKTSPTLTLTGQDAAKTFSELMPQLNDSAANAQNLTNTIESAVQMLDKDITVTMNDEAMLKRVMRDTINTMVNDKVETFQNSMMNAMENKAGGWKGAVEKTIWNRNEVQTNDFVKLLKANGYLDAANEAAGTYPIFITDSDAKAVTIKADTTMISAVVDEVVGLVNEKLDDLEIGAVLTNANSTETGYSANTNQYNERYLQVVGRASLKDLKEGEKNELQLAFDSSKDVTVTVKLEGKNPTYYIQLNDTGKANVLTGGVLKITKTADANLPEIVNDAYADARIEAYEANMPASVRFNKTEWSWTINPGLEYSAANGYRLGELDLTDPNLTQTVSVGTPKIDPIDLDKVNAPVPVSNLGGKDALDRRVTTQRNNFNANGQAQKALDDLYDVTSNKGYLNVTEEETELKDSDGNVTDTVTRIDKVTLDEGILVEVLPSKGTVTDEEGKETVIHVVTNPANWTGTGKNYLDGLIEKADAIRQGITDDNGSYAPTSFYNRLGRGSFSDGFNGAWKTGFDKSNMLSTRGAFAAAAAKKDSTPADLWRSLGLSEANAKDTMTYQMPKDSWDSTGGKNEKYMNVLRDVLVPKNANGTPKTEGQSLDDLNIHVELTVTRK